MLRNIQSTVLANGLYNAFFVIGLLTAFSFGLWYRKKFHFSMLKAGLLIVMFFAVLLIWTVVHFLLETGFSGLGTKSVVRALPYLMLIIWPISALLKLKWTSVCDFIAPLVCLYLGIAQIGCVFAGCCEGYPCKWGIYNRRYDGPAFPVQIIEIISLMMLFLGLLWYNRKHDYQNSGRTVPVMLICFGTIRFVLEFMRNNEKLCFGFSAISFHTIFMILVGTETLFTIRDIKKGKTRNPKKKAHRT